MSAATSITVRVPITIRKRGGRRLVVAPEGQGGWAPSRARVDSTLIKALARAHRWQRMLDEGRYGSVRELADGVGVKPSYAAGMLRLTLLAPDIVAAIMDGQQPGGMSLSLLMGELPSGWGQQRFLIGDRPAMMESY